VTPYRGRRMHQISSQWEWEEQMAEERAEAAAQHKLSLRRDYGWHRSGWRWEVRLSWLNDAGEAVYTERIIPLLFWREHTAALVSNAIFCAYEDGRSVQRKAGSFAPAQRGGEA
jgi:hypothetical protein